MAINLVQGKQIATASWARNALTASYLDGYTSPFPFTGSAQITGSLGITGSLNVTQGITGSLFGTASFAVSSSRAATSSFAISASQAQNSISSSYPLAVTGSTLRSTYVAGGSGANTIGSIFIGNQAGINAISASNSNFIGNGAGDTANNASNSNFIGFQAGRYATNALQSNFLGNGAGYSATNAFASNFFGQAAGSGATSASYSNFLGRDAGNGATNASNSNFLGNAAGFSATSANNSNFLGQGAGSGATSAYNSNFLGNEAGYIATNAYRSNFLGFAAGQSATNAYGANFLGYGAGLSATNTNYSNFLGTAAGWQATNANNSNFLGFSAGQQATNASNSNFMGYQAGFSATSASYSTLLGYYAGSSYLQQTAVYVPSIGSNNIIIGTNITLQSGRRDSINLGAIIFATGSYSDTATDVFSGSLGTGRVGINNPNPNYTLDVLGSVNFTGNLYQNGTLFESGDTQKYMWYSIQIISYTLRYTVAPVVNPQQGMNNTSLLDSILPYTYVDIIDQYNNTTYTSLTFPDVSEIQTFISDNDIYNGRAIIYSNRNNTGNLRVGGVNLFSTQITPRGRNGKVSSKRSYEVDPGKTAYSTLALSLIDTLVSECSDIVPNFSANYINQDQVEAIVANPNPNDNQSYYSFAPISKYKKRQFSRYYVGRKNQGIDVNGNIVNVSNPGQAKILGVAVYEWDSSIFLFRSFITNYGYSTPLIEKLGPLDPEGSMLNVYIVQTSDDCRALVIEPIGVDRILIPPSFDKISEIHNDPILPDLTIYRKGNATQIATYSNRVDNELGISTYLSPTLFQNFRVKTISEVDVINLYSDRTCDLFEKAVKLDKLKYTNKKFINLTLLNSNYQKN